MGDDGVIHVLNVRGVFAVFAGTISQPEGRGFKSRPRYDPSVRSSPSAGGASDLSPHPTTGYPGSRICRRGILSVSAAHKCGYGDRLEVASSLGIVSSPWRRRAVRIGGTHRACFPSLDRAHPILMPRDAYGPFWITCHPEGVSRVS